MSVYRESPCAFCAVASSEDCPRCRAHVCAAHGLCGRAHCAACTKELADDVDVALFGLSVHDVPPDSGGLFQARRSLLGDAVDGIVRSVREQFARRRARRLFDRRTAEEIAEWRRKAGVAVRPRP